MSDHPKTPGYLPDLEDLAAFAEQRLDGSARQAVMDRLASDEEYYEVYVELLRFREDEAELLAGLEEDAGGAVAIGPTVVPEPRRPVDDAEPSGPAEGSGTTGDTPALDNVLRPSRWRRWAPVAGLAAMLAMAAGLWLILGTAVSFEPDDLARNLTPQEGDLGAPVGAVYRGGYEDSMLVLEPMESFLLGAQIMDLKVAEARGDEQRLKICRAQIAETAEKDKLLELHWDHHSQDVTEFTRSLLEHEYADSFYLHYGMWARAVWLAGRGQEYGYLARKELADWLDRLRGQQWPDDEATAADLEELASLLEAGEYGDLIEKVEQVAREYESDFRTPAASEGY